MELGPTSEVGKDIHVFGNLDGMGLSFFIDASLGEDFSSCCDLGCRAHPTHDGFVVDSHGHDIEAAFRDVLPPMEGRIGGKEITAVSAFDR